MNLFTQSNIQRITFAFLFFLSLVVVGKKEAVAQDKVQINADSLFLVARQYAFNNNYKKAFHITEKILAQNPDYYDVLILQCRMFAWKGDYAKAKEIASEVLTKDPKNYDAYDALSSIYLWNNQNEECVVTINKALYLFEDDVNLLIKKTKALLASKNYSGAQETVDILLGLDPENSDIKKLSDRVRIESTHENPINADSLFVVARNKAANGDYVVARQTADQILELFPDYTDAQLLVARTYAWDKRYDLAQKELGKVLSEDDKNYDALDLQIDIYFWDKKYDLCSKSIDDALITYPKDIHLLSKKFKVQVALKDNVGAEKTLKYLEELDPENTIVKGEKKKIAVNQPYRNIIRVEYNYETFNEPWKRMWNMTGLSYGRRTKKYGDFYANIFMADLVLPGESFGKDLGYQFELECYPKIDDNNTFFFSYAYSPSSIFSTHRLGIEYYRSFPDIIDFSLGYRYMNFSNDLETPVNVNILTGSVSKYFGNYWLSFRPYVVFASNVEKVNSNYQLIGRKYLNRPESFVGLTLGYGITSPDNSSFSSYGSNIPFFNTYAAQAQFKYRLTSFLLLDTYFVYENAEYEPGLHRGQINFRIALSCLLY